MEGKRKHKKSDFRSCFDERALRRLRSLRRYLKGSSPKTSKVPQAFAEGGTDGGGERGTEALKLP